MEVSTMQQKTTRPAKRLLAAGIFLLSITMKPSVTVAADPTIVRIQAPESENDTRPLHYRAMLDLAMDKTKAEYGEYKIELTKSKAIQGRNIHNLAKGRHIDLIWTMTDLDREKKLLPVRIPLLKGLLGHRVCLIRKGTEEKFKGLKSPADFKKNKVVLGSGLDWPDTKILRAGGFRVFDGSNYEGLFGMLEKKRFDCYARGVNEAWAEVETHKDKPFAVDPHLAIVYKSPIYFFVNKENAKLAERLEKGLRAAIKDGSFDKVFEKYQGKFLKNAKLKDRTIIRIDNPIMPPKTPIQEKELWLSFDQGNAH